MDLRQLRMFVAVGEELHFGRAARRLQIAQPALSQALKRFEHELGAPLLERTTRRVSLTEAGEVLLERARAILVAVAAAEDDIRRAHSGEIGTLHVGFTTVAPHRLLPRLAESHGQRWPNVRLVPENVPSVLQIERLNRGTLDAGLLWLPPRPGALDLSKISNTTLARETLVVVLPERHRFVKEKKLSIGQLSEEEFVTYIQNPGGSVVRGAAELACRAAGFSPHIAQEAPDANSLLRIVSVGVGIALMPECISEMLVPGTVAVALDIQEPVLEFVLAWSLDDKGVALRGLREAVCDLELAPG